uniref:Vicilin, 14 kDa component n=1 Tax=Pisum sativum TaxID=3888 RepID=VCL1_PEA|nr:RecName: Full=Vicilin, 14 kDa component [Pisum sativum]prf//0809262A vicilin [Pisum sativum]
DRRQELSNENVLVKVSRRQLEELSKNAKSSSRRSVSSESGPFNLRSEDPLYSNNSGKFFELTPEKNQQLQDLDLFVNSVDLKEGSLLLPNYNSRALLVLVLVVNEGKGDFELVGQRNENQGKEN